MTLQFRRGTDSDRLTITPAVGEPIYTTDTKSLYIGDGSTAGGTLVTGSGGVDSASTQAIIDSNIGAIGADLLPALDSTYDLGSASKKWKDLHLSGNSIFLGGHKIVKDGDTIKFTDSAGATINVTAGNVASSLIDSSDVTAIITAGGYTTYDSTNAAGQITTAINNLVDAAPASLDTLNELAAALNDDANFASTITGQIAALPDSAQVATIVTSYGYTTYDSGNTTGLIDSAYINARTDANLDSAATIALVDSAYVQARQTAQDFAYSSLTGAPNVLDSADVALIAQANDTTRDSAFVTGIIDSAYVAARVAAGTDSATVSSIVTTTVDSAYVQLRQATVSSGATTITTFNYEADSGQTTFSGADIDGASLTYTSGKLNVYLNGILLVDSNDYTATNGTSVVLNTAADSADTVTVISYITQAVGTLDSAGVTNLIDSAYIQARQVDLQRDSGFVTGIVDSAYINARVSATDSATVSAIITADVDAAFINALTIGADSLGGQAPSYYLDYNNFTNTPTIPTAVSDLTNDTGFTTFDSTNATGLITSYGYSTYDSGNFTGQLAAASTSDLSEGTNLYYTTARHDSDFDARLSGGTGVTVSSGQVSIGQAVATTDSVTFAGLTVSGNLNVTGTTTTVNSITYTVTDPLLHLADSNETSDLVDIGFVGHYSPDGGSTKEHTGFFRDASNAEYYIFNGLVDAAFDSSLPTNVVDRNGTGFELATLNVGSIVGQYAGFDSDVTAAGLTTYDSGNFTGQLTAATGSSVLAYDANLQSFVTAFTLPTSDGSTNQVLVTNGSGTISFADQSGGIDSAAAIAIVDSAYVQARQSAVSSGATTISTFNFEADSGQTTFSGADIDGSNLTYTAGKLNVYLNGILLVDSNDYTATNGTSVVLNTAADSSDVVSIISYITQSVGTLDSAGVTSLIDSAYVAARTSAGTDSATVSAIITADVDAAFINALTIGADSLGGQAPSYYLDYNNFSNTPTIPTAVSDLTNDTGFTTYDSANTTGMLTSYATLASPTFTGTPLAPTATAGTNTTQIATTAFVTTAVDNLVDAAPGALDTLNELAAALGDDANFSATITGQIAALPDSAQVATIVTSYGYSTYDSGNFTGQLTNSVLRGLIDDSSLTIDGDGSTGGVTIEDGGITIRTGTGNVAYADFYCEVTNAHRTRVKSAAHADYSGNVDVTLPTSTGTLALTSDIPTAVSSLTNDANYLDSTTVQGVIDATYIQANQTTFLDSALTTQLIDSAYVQARQSSTGGTDPIFKTISVSGQSDVVADTITDTLTFVAGTNMTITTDASTDTITFTASGGGGGLDSAATNILIDAKLQVTDVTDLVGADGNPGEYLKTLGNGETEWSDLATQAKQKAFAMALIFG